MEKQYLVEYAVPVLGILKWLSWKQYATEQEAEDALATERLQCGGMEYIFRVRRLCKEQE